MVTFSEGERSGVRGRGDSCDAWLTICRPHVGTRWCVDGEQAGSVKRMSVRGRAGRCAWGHSAPACSRLCGAARGGCAAPARAAWHSWSVQHDDASWSIASETCASWLSVPPAPYCALCHWPRLPRFSHTAGNSQLRAALLLAEHYM
jgi:hypothetical protein